MDTKPGHLPPMLSERLALSAASEAKRSNVLPFRPAVAKESPLATRLRAIQRANDEFWSRPGPHIEQAGRAFAHWRKAQKQAAGKALRHVVRNRRIYDAYTNEGKSAAQIAKNERMKAGQVRKILKKPRP